MIDCQLPLTDLFVYKYADAGTAVLQKYSDVPFTEIYHGTHSFHHGFTSGPEFCTVHSLNHSHREIPMCYDRSTLFYYINKLMIL